MAIITADVFRCDHCGYTWFPYNKSRTLRCPNRECRTRRWNSKQAAVFVPESGDGSYPRYDVMEVMKASSRTIPSSPVSAEGYQVTREDVSRTVDQYLPSKKS